MNIYVVSLYDHFCNTIKLNAARRYASCGEHCFPKDDSDNISDVIREVSAERVRLRVPLILRQYKFISERKGIADSINLPFCVPALSLLVNFQIHFDKAIMHRLK
jgi:hypothetical protein